MQIVKLINLAVAFLLELFLFAALGFWGFQNEKSLFWKYALALALPLVAITLWGLFAAPRSDYRLEMPYRMLFEMVLFLVAAFLLYRAGYVKTAFAFAAVALISQAIAYAFKQ